MAVMIANGRRSSGLKGMLENDPDLVLKVGVGIAGAALMGSILFLGMGMRDYGFMKDMQLEWNEVSRIAYGDRGGDVPKHDQFVEVGTDGEAWDGMQAESGQAVYVPNDMLYKSVDLEALRILNKDVSGFIHIPGIPVDYPILQEQSAGEYYYIDHDIYGNYDRYGSVFELCDEERGEDSAVTWVFGHHMASGSMFSGLYQYLEQDFKDTPIYVYRDDYRIEYAPVGACVIDMNDSVYEFGAYELGSDVYGQMLDNLAKSRRTETAAAWPDADTPILVLSTCYGNAGTSKRLIVVATESRMVVTPEYYRSLREVQEYGGDQEGIPESELPEGASGVGEDSVLSGMEDGLEMNSVSGSAGNSIGTGSWYDWSSGGYGSGMGGLTVDP